MDSIASLLKMTNEFYSPWTSEKAAEYYIARMQTLTHYRNLVQDQKRNLSITYSDLVDNHRKTLIQLQEFLNLEKPLSPVYSLRKFTGKKGDPSAKIYSGKIIKCNYRYNLKIEKKLLKRAKDAFCKFHLKEVPEGQC